MINIRMDFSWRALFLEGDKQSGGPHSNHTGAKETRSLWNETKGNGNNRKPVFES